MTTWDPERYLTYADERGRPFHDLVARVAAERPARVVDLGCGPGNLTATLATRWPDADVRGVDSSPEMIARAERHAAPGLTFEVGDVNHWQPSEPVDVIISNATLQWVRGHRALVPRLIEHLAPGGWLAFQVPANFTEPSHTLLHDLTRDPRFAAATAGVSGPASHEPADYLGDLMSMGGLRVEAWETTYQHVLTGDDPVFTWISGTGARPVLQALSDGQRAEFERLYRRALREAYPARPWGTLLPFRRVFVVAQKEKTC